MKRKILIGVGVVILALVGFATYSFLTTRNLSPKQTSDYSANGLDIKVTYGRPSKRGRLIFGEEKDKALQPNGKYWRMGANDATEITFSKNVTFAGQPVNAGGYRMYAMLDAASWKITLNSELGKFGYFEPDHALDVLTVEVPVATSPTEVEQFTINFSSDSTAVNMDFLWDKTLVRVPLTVQ